MYYPTWKVPASRHVLPQMVETSPVSCQRVLAEMEKIISKSPPVATEVGAPREESDAGDIVISKEKEETRNQW